ncbi:MAG: hypothetical protein QM784_33245 [Polyangiaceae bacterium]
MVLRAYGVVLRAYGVVLRAYGVVLRAYGVVLRAYGVVLRAYGVVLRGRNRSAACAETMSGNERSGLKCVADVTIVRATDPVRRFVVMRGVFLYADARP